ncbi:MAG: hemerythrin domain-containing protein [Pseudonocardiaceae bacterium]
MEKQSRAQDAIALLMEDHKKVQKMFKDYDKLKEQEGADEDKSQLAEQICDELTIHTHIEEEIFYPAARDAIDDDDMLDEAEVEHASAKELISQLESMEPGDELYDAKVTVLGEYINHHVKEEQDEMFPKVRKSKLDLYALGAEMKERKQELQAERGLAAPMDDEDEMPVAKPASRGGKKPVAGARK